MARYIIPLLWLALSSSGFAADDAAPPPAKPPGKDIADMNLEELLKVKIRVASKTETTLSTAPGIVTVITRREIVESGARSLLDVLYQVPGFQFGLDQIGVVGVGVRGNWGHEGKVLLLIDGLEMNETMFGTLQFYDHYPIDFIDRIEIIRGPGSVVYGGYAELAVINIVTLDGKALSGASLKAQYGQLDKYRGRAAGAMAAGGMAGGWNVSGSFRTGEIQYADKTYTDSTGATYDLRDGSVVRPTHLNLGAKKDDLELRLIVDRYATRSQDAFGTSLPFLVNNDFTALLAGAKYTIAAGPGAKVTPELTFRKYWPWITVDTAAIAAPGLYYNKTANRYTGKLGVTYDLDEHYHLAAGVEAYDETAHDYVGTFSNGSPDVDYQNIALYAEILGDLGFANLTVGARGEYHSQYHGSLVPRVALTKDFGKGHVKVLYSMAFHSPSIENINTSTGLVPERTSVVEIEGGYTITPDLSVVANVFDNRITKPIVYDYVAADFYKNFGKVGTQGFELGGKLRHERGSFNVSWSFYRSNGSDVALYAVPTGESQLLGFSPHKVTASAPFQLTKGVVFTPSLVFLSSAYAYAYDATSGGLVLASQPRRVLVNLYLSANDVLSKGLGVGLGLYNALGQNFAFIQPYNGGHPPLPALSRELALRVSYDLPF